MGNQDTAALVLSGYSAPTAPVRHRRAHKNICRPLVGRKIVIYILISSIWIYAPTSRKSDIYYHIISIYKQPDRHARYFKCLNSLLWHPGEPFDPLKAVWWRAGTWCIAINGKYWAIWRIYRPKTLFWGYRGSEISELGLKPQNLKNWPCSRPGSLQGQFFGFSIFDRISDISDPRYPQIWIF